MKKPKLSSNNFIPFSLAVLFLSLLGNIAALATPAEEKGLEIAREMERRDTGWQNFSASLAMILKNRQGEKSMRRLRAKTLENAAAGDKTLMIFDSPRDVKDTAFLTISHKSEDDDQWLYLPALKRVKRISSANKGGSFMGSEFAYEDMSPPIIEKYTYNHLRDETYKGRPCHVVERYPTDKRSLYNKHVVWIDSKQYIPWKIEYYNRRNKHLKTLVYRKYKRYLKKFWRPGEMYMVNLRTKKSTILAWKDYAFHIDVSDSDFSPRVLTRSH